MSGNRPGPLVDYESTVPEAAEEGSTVVLLLHGRGSHEGDLQTLAPLLPSQWALVTPRAPFPGAPWGYGPGYAWYRYEEEDRVATETLEESLAALDDFCGRVPEIVGFEPGRVVMGGFSQGGTTSLAYAISRPDAVAVALNFSGFLAASVALDETGAAPPTTPLFWGHGTGDPAIPISLAERGRGRLRRSGAELVSEDYRIGHWIAPEEVADAVAMVEDVGRRPSAV